MLSVIMFSRCLEVSASMKQSEALQGDILRIYNMNRSFHFYLFISSIIYPFIYRLDQNLMVKNNGYAKR